MLALARHFSMIQKLFIMFDGESRFCLTLWIGGAAAKIGV
jgi:hypothetical protein